ncbi:phytanoyl-CoA dioxygenase family protein [Paeniglutamicibacter cryotolerans]|uniref:Ectoine hydroxylase-related dioxygenase (Phytanoyl-CoA dioxygenase family) n=1 Tax=Paeniglutamicibacter cryotolerans TaxID=670079 RepID=A0A839QHU7_9MICC|nr:phytanoyl-CoA dioxygenase family protein [Paeniglutamicibacter cryotolerans]MBB2995450.1 ectoine hydroxylase-related dioxygenase (phytanoyl-CoA dioxygenase family) [Paeniglutamicibacter cryotolerans]
MTATPTTAGSPRWFHAEDCNIEDFAAVVSATTSLEDYPFADTVEQNVLIYGPRLHSAVDSREDLSEIQAELARALTEGPGIVVFKGAFPDPAVVDRTTQAFNRLIEAQKAAGSTGGDHFAKPGANDRVWGALDKLALAEPAVFAEYYGSKILALVSEAWLGPNYQVTSQVNVVNPGGQAQRAHRDYHLGFMSSEQAAAYPAHTHLLTPTLTLQGAVAHCDMPLESGPTLYLPHSHKYGPGYVAFHRQDFTEYFQEHHVQLPLRKGDAVFFNPALFHGAGTNVSADIKRMANLLQVSSAFGRAMETVDRVAMSKSLYPILLGLQDSGTPAELLHNIIAASAEGYAFPTNLDRDQPIGGLAPLSQAELVAEHLERNAAPTELNDALDALATRGMTEEK